MRKVLMLMMAMFCLMLLMAPPVSAQTYFSTFDGAIYYSAPASYVTPMTYSYSGPIGYSAPVSYSTTMVYAADDPANCDRCPQCGRHHIPKGMKVVGTYQTPYGSGVITQPAQRSSPVSYSTSYTRLPSYAMYSAYRSSGNCATGNCSR